MTRALVAGFGNSSLKDIENGVAKIAAALSAA